MDGFVDMLLIDFICVLWKIIIAMKFCRLSCNHDGHLQSHYKSIQDWKRFSYAMLVQATKDRDGRG